jgi:uncharacterized protein (DUF58 family)
MNLTPAAVIAIALVGLLGIAGQWSAAVGTFPWWRLAAALLVLGAGYELWVSRRSRVAARWLGGERLFLGRPERLRLELANGSERALRVRLAPALPAGLRRDDPAPAGSGILAVRLPPGGREAVTVDLRAIELGEQRWPPLPVRIRGPLHLAWWSRSVAMGETLRVAPDTLGTGAVTSGTAMAGAAGRATPGAGLELDRLRPYRPGDPRRMIDWKATARAASLVTRVFSEDQHLELVIALDAGRTSRIEIDGMSQLGHYANLAARFAEHCAAGDDLVGLVTFADVPLTELAPGRGIAAVTRIRRALAELAPRAVESDPLEAAVCVRRLVRRRCLVVLLTDLYERGSGDRLAQAVRLLAPHHLPVVVGLVSRDVEGFATTPARHRLDPYRSLAAREHERRLRGGIARLARLGALAMTAHPNELDRKVLERYRLLRAQRRI